MITALSDLLPLALPQFRTSQLQGRGRSPAAGTSGRSPGANKLSLVYNSSPWDSALDMAGISGTLRSSLGLQVSPQGDIVHTGMR